MFYNFYNTKTLPLNVFCIFAVLFWRIRLHIFDLFPCAQKPQLEKSMRNFVLGRQKGN